VDRSVPKCFPWVTFAGYDQLRAYIWLFSVETTQLREAISKKTANFLLGHSLKRSAFAILGIFLPLQMELALRNVLHTGNFCIANALNVALRRPEAVLGRSRPVPELSPGSP